MRMLVITGVVREHDHPLPARDGGGELVEGEDGVGEHERRGARERGDARVVEALRRKLQRLEPVGPLRWSMAACQAQLVVNKLTLVAW